MCEDRKIMKQQNMFINVLLVITLLLLWSGIFLFTVLFWLWDGFLSVDGGVFLYVLGVLYLSAFVLPILLRNRIKKYISLPLSMIISTFFAMILAGGVLFGAKGYISDFTPEKWSGNPNLRYCMTKDLEEEYDIIGLKREEITRLLGSPDFDAESKMIYIIGMNLIDPIYYEIELENGMVAQTRTVTH